MWKHGVITLFMNLLAAAASPLIFKTPQDTPFSCPDTQKLPWDVDESMCDQKSHLQVEWMLNHSRCGINIFNLLTEEEKNDYDELQNLVTTEVYKRSPVKLPLQPTNELHAQSQQELREFCTSAEYRSLTLPNDDLDEDGCVSLPLNNSNILFNSPKYPHLHSFTNFVTEAMSITEEEKGWACLNSFDDSNRDDFHIDNSQIVSVNTDPTLSTRIMVDPPLLTINLERLKLASRWKSSSSCMDTDSTINRFEAENKFWSLERGLLDVRENQPRISYLPSGEIYRLNHAIHDAPKPPADSKDCRVVLFKVNPFIP